MTQLRWVARAGASVFAAVLLVACSGSGPGPDAARVGGPTAPGSTADRVSAGPTTTAPSTAAAGGSRGAAVAPASTASSTRPAQPPTPCAASSEPAVTGGEDGEPVAYTGTGTGSYTTPDGTGVSYAFPPRWTYVWRAGERLVELTATDALGTWGMAAGSADEALSHISAVYLTAPDGSGGSMTFAMRLATPIAFTALKPGATASGRAADDSVLVTVRRPGAARAFDLVLRDGPCPASDGIGSGTLSIALEGAVAPWSGMRFDFDVRLDDDQLKGALQLRRG